MTDSVSIDSRPEEQFSALLDDDDETCEILSPEEIAEEIERLIYLRACDLVEQWELADSRDRWRHTGEAPPKASDIPAAKPPPYYPAQSSVDAFWFVVAQCDPDRLKRWLHDHPEDAPFLLKLLEGK